MKDLTIEKAIALIEELDTKIALVDKQRSKGKYGTDTDILNYLNDIWMVGELRDKYGEDIQLLRMKEYQKKHYKYVKKADRSI